MNKQSQIESLLKENCRPAHLEVVNESHLHQRPGNETHYKIVVIADLFEGMSMVKRHQKIYSVLMPVSDDIHALALHTFTKNEWNERKNSNYNSPKCKSVEK